MRCGSRPPTATLHSGIFGGAAQNPIRVLTRILGGLHDDNGRITIPGFYDGVKDLPSDILAQWKKLNLTPESFLKTDRAVDPRRREGPAADRAGLFAPEPATSTGSSAAIPGRARRPSFRRKPRLNLVPSGRGSAT